MDRVLITYGREHGTTGEIALAVGEQVSRAGFHVDVRPFSSAGAPHGYAALIAGSVVRRGSWEESALRYLEQQPDAPSRTWLFQWSPGEVPGPLDLRVRRLLAQRDWADPITFDGALGPWSPEHTRHVWSRVPLSGDRLRWRQIQRWAHALATELSGDVLLAG